MTGTTPRPARASIIIVDDEENMVRILQRVLELEGYHAKGFSSSTEAVAAIQQHPPDLVLTDMRMPDMDGMEVLQATREANPQTSIIVMTAHGSIEMAVEAMRAGAYDYITKPFKTEELLLTISKALEHVKLVQENEALTETLNRQAGRSAELVGESPAIERVRSLIEKVAVANTPILINGESGTGKELAAKAIHRHSGRAKRRFVAINCATLPENLMESELFGHEKGAFTGADKTKMGLMELASGGTLFLDEIGELPMGLQAKLLRALQEQEIQRVGGMHPISIDVRLLAATNRNLKVAMEKKEFREDLYFRLNVIQLELPPLRSRQGDVAVLVDHFLNKLCQRMNREVCVMADDALEALENYGFPGNVRELENVIERCIVLSDGPVIELEDIPPDIRREAKQSMTSSPEGATESAVKTGEVIEYRTARDNFDREYLIQAVATAKGNISEAARITGLSRRHFYEKLDKLNIKTER